MGLWKSQGRYSQLTPGLRIVCRNRQRSVRTVPEFRFWFSDEQACATFLEQLRWPAGFRCPKCECAKGWQMADGRWSCSGCARKVSVTAGTIFDRSRIPRTEEGPGGEEGR